MNTYKNLCTSPIFIKSIGQQIVQNATFECEDNDEMKSLVKESKVGIVDSEENDEETKPTKKGRKKKTSEPEDNSEQEDESQNF